MARLVLVATMVLRSTLLFLFPLHYCATRWCVAAWFLNEEYRFHAPEYGVPASVRVRVGMGKVMSWPLGFRPYKDRYWSRTLFANSLLCGSLGAFAISGLATLVAALRDRCRPA